MMLTDWPKIRFIVQRCPGHCTYQETSFEKPVKFGVAVNCIANNIANINFPDKQSPERHDSAWDLDPGNLQPKLYALSIRPG
jgi:hypothetical protein